MFCVLLIAMGLYGVLTYFPKDNLRETPVSVHLLTSGEVDGRYIICTCFYQCYYPI